MFCCISFLVAFANTELNPDRQKILNRSNTTTHPEDDADNVTLPCNVTSTSFPKKITWYKDDAVINTSSGRLYGGSPDSPSLRIQPVLDEDSGAYICGVTDLLGTINVTALALTVQDGVVNLVRDTEGGDTKISIVTFFPALVCALSVLACCMLVAKRASRKNPALLSCSCCCRPTAASFSQLAQDAIDNHGSELPADPRCYASQSWHQLQSAVWKSPKSVVLIQCVPIWESELLAKEWCEEIINNMTDEMAKVALQTVVKTLPIQTLPYLGLHSPVNWDRVDDSAVPRWCLCGLCINSDNSREQVCCGMEECISKDMVFVDLCTKAHVLQMATLQNVAYQLLHSSSQKYELSSRDLRSLACQFFMLWQSSRCGHSSTQCMPLPSCVLVRIQWAFPDMEAEGHGQEAGFQQHQFSATSF